MDNNDFKIIHLKQVIDEFFPGYWEPTLATLAVAAQLKLEGVHNPFSLVFIGPPSDGKTTQLSMFKRARYTHHVDQFTPASFVSSMAGKSGDELSGKIDLLPKIKDKILVIPELAPLFGANSDDLKKKLSILTRVLDGEGLVVASGAHGDRGYSDKHLFMLLGASTPFSNVVWKAMGNLGPRLLFFNFPQRTDEETHNLLLDIVVTESDYTTKLELCREALQKFLEPIMNSEKKFEIRFNDRELATKVSLYGQLLACGRGIVKGVSGNNRDDDDNYHPPVIEKPLRVVQLLTNFCKAMALINGRSEVSEPDISLLRNIVIASMPPTRGKIVEFLLDHDGVIETDTVVELIGATDDTARNYFQRLEVLGVGQIIPGRYPTEKKRFRLDHKFMSLRDVPVEHCSNDDQSTKDKPPYIGGF